MINNSMINNSMISNSIILSIIVLLFLVNEFLNNKILKTFNKIYKCYKVILVVVPIVLFYFNPKLLEIVNKYLLTPSGNKDYFTKKDILFNLASVNNIKPDRDEDKCSSKYKCQQGGNYFGNK